MDAVSTFDAALVVAIALVVGTIAQILSRHMKIPGIVLMLAAGTLLGPDFVNIIRPDMLQTALQTLVGFAVAVILFEGGMNLNIKRILREQRVIRQLITYGAIITMAGGAAGAHYILGWSWELSLLFGTLVIVTGPTVINPIVRRIKLNRNIATILEAEGLLIDPIGAIIAIVTLEVILHPSTGFFSGIIEVILSLGVGVVNGIIGGFIIALLLRPKNLIPDGMANIFVLTSALALFQTSNFLQAESGIGAVTVAGLVVGNFKNRALEELMEFKEQLTVMFIGMLFVLLAADVRIIEIERLGMAGILTVIALMFVVRPINVFLSTFGSGLRLKDKLFISWLAPRGIIAAAIASYFAIELERAGIEGGNELRALVFLVIAVTVVVQGLTGGPVASLLKIRRKSNRGFVILGSNQLSIALGQELKTKYEDIVFIDSNFDACHLAETAGFRVIYGNGMEESVMQRAGIDTMTGAIGLTPNEENNLLFTTRAYKLYKIPLMYISMHLKDGHVTGEMVQRTRAHILFGSPKDTDLWTVRIRRKLVTVERWKSSSKDEIALPDKQYENSILPLVYYRGDKVFPIDGTTKFRKDDVVTFILFKEQYEKAKEWFTKSGWVFDTTVTEDPPEETRGSSVQIKNKD